MTENTHGSFGGSLRESVSITSDENGVVSEDNTQPSEPQAEAPVEETKILGKFESQADLEKAYQELESKLGKSNEQGRNEEDTSDSEGEFSEESEETKLPSDEVDESSEEDVENTEELDESDESVSDEKVTPKSQVDGAFKALAEAGEMTDEVKEQFEAVGISEELVGQFRELVEFKAEVEYKEQVGIAGGKDQYAAMLVWAKENLTDSEVSTFDATIDTGVSDDIKSAIKNLKARMDTTGKKKSNLVKADKVAKGRSVYENEAAFHKDQADERWSTDPNYRELVMAKLSRSKFNK
jgi:hypothetical protein